MGKVITPSGACLLESLRATGQRHAPQDDVNAALAAVDGTRPENEMAAMLAGQMAVTHALAMDMLSRTKRAGFIDGMHAYGALATKLLRTYTMQTEALAKLKRGGEQTVRVEHVHAYPGGQAVVGAVSGDLPAWCSVRKECAHERSFRRNRQTGTGICANLPTAGGTQ